MGLRHRGRTDGCTINPAEVKKQHARDIAELYVDYLREKQITAIEVDRHLFYFYQRKTTGRRCSCWTLESAPRRDCPVCWGTGVPIGYEKFGCWSWVFDASVADVCSVNVGFNIEEQTRPVRWSLMDGCNYGRLEFRVLIPASDTSVLDAYEVNHRGCTILIKGPADSDWIPIGNLAQRMGVAYLDFRIEFTRREDGSGAWLEYLFFRKRIKSQDFIQIAADIPRSADSVQFGEYWSVDVWTQIQLYVTGDKLKNITSRDFFKEVNGSGMWKITENNPNKPIGVLISHDITARSVLQDEIYLKIP